MSNKTTHKDFIRPEDDRPEKGPVYAINTSRSRIVFERRDGIAGVNFGPAGTPDSVRQIDIKMLDVVEFMRLWATGMLAVSTSSKVAQTYTSLELDRAIAKSEEENRIIESITTRDASNDYTVDTSEAGTPRVSKVGDNVVEQHDEAPTKRDEDEGDKPAPRRNARGKNTKDNK